MKSIRMVRIRNRNIVINVISGATALTQVLRFDNAECVPEDIEAVSQEEAEEILGGVIQTEW